MFTEILILTSLFQATPTVDTSAKNPFDYGGLLVKQTLPETRRIAMPQFELRAMVGSDSKRVAFIVNLEDKKEFYLQENEVFQVQNAKDERLFFKVKRIGDNEVELLPQDANDQLLIIR